MKNWYFNKLIGGDNIPQGAYNKAKEDFELKCKREILIRLKTEISSKNNEISILKVN